MLEQHRGSSRSGRGLGWVSGCRESKNTYSNTSDNGMPSNRANHWPTATELLAASTPTQGNMNVTRSIFELIHFNMQSNSASDISPYRFGPGGCYFESSFLSPRQAGAGAGFLQVHRPSSGNSFTLGLGQTQGRTSGIRPAAATASAAHLVNEFQTTSSSPLTPGERMSLVTDLLCGTPSNLSILDSFFNLNRQTSSTTTNRDLGSALIAQLGNIPASRLCRGMTADFSALLNMDSGLSTQIQIMQMQRQEQLRAQDQRQQEFRQKQVQKEKLKQILASLSTSALVALAESTQSFRSNSNSTSDTVEMAHHSHHNSSRIPLSDSDSLPKMEPGSNQNIQNRGGRLHEEGNESDEKDQEDKSSWNAKFSALCELMTNYDLHEIPSQFPGVNKEEIDLNNWIKMQKKQYQLFQEGHTRGLSITPIQIEKLESVGFQSMVSNSFSAPRKTRSESSTQKAHVELWNERYEELKAYKENFGDCLVPERYKKNHRLGTWVRTQRKHYKLMKDGKRSSMKSERIEKLNSIGFVWTVR